MIDANGYHWRKLKIGGDRFQARKSEGGKFYEIIIGNASYDRVRSQVIEDISVEDKCPQLQNTPSQA